MFFKAISAPCSAKRHAIAALPNLLESGIVNPIRACESYITSSCHTISLHIISHNISIISEARWEIFRLGNASLLGAHYAVLKLYSYIETRKKHPGSYIIVLRRLPGNLPRLGGPPRPCIKSYHISYHITSYHISHHIISYITSHHIIYHITSYHISHHIISYHIISYHIMPHIISHHIISHQIISHHITSYHITSHHIISYISHHITSHHITSHHIISHHIISIITSYDISLLSDLLQHVITQYILNVSSNIFALLHQTFPCNAIEHF